MRIAMMGSGGVGGLFGARLVESGNDVVFLARGEHLDAMRAGGLRVESAHGDLHLAQVAAERNPAAVGPVDLVIVSVKLADAEAVAPTLVPLVGPRTVVVSLQNGIDKDEILARALGREHVVGGVTYVNGTLAEPGRIVQAGTVQRIIVGELDGGRSERVGAAVATLRAAGIDAEESADIRRVMWEKFVFLTATSALTSATRLPIDLVRGHPATRGLLAEAMREAVAVARAEGVALPDDFVDGRIAFIDTLAAGSRSSMATDLLRGGRLELEWLSGTLVRRGERLGVATPVHRVLYAILAPFSAGTPS